MGGVALLRDEMNPQSGFVKCAAHLKLASRKEIELTSLATINFSVFRRTESCKVILDCDSLHQNPSKIYSP